MSERGSGAMIYDEVYEVGSGRDPKRQTPDAEDPPMSSVMNYAGRVVDTVPTPDDRNPKDLLGIRKPQLNLVPPASMIYQALAMEDGARKYGPYNWRSKKVIASIYAAAAMRHLIAWLDGEEDAPDSGKPHLAHALACLGIIVDAKETGNLVDDRPVPGAASALLARFEKKS